MTLASTSSLLTDDDASRPALAMAAVSGIETTELAAMPEGTLATARVICQIITGAAVLKGFNDGSRVDGADAVELLGLLWPQMKVVAGAAGAEPSVG